MPAFDVARRWKGRVMLDRAGAKLGTIVDIYYDAEVDEPGWALLNTADIGASMRLVPVGQAVEDGNEIRVPYHRAFVEAAPGMEAGGRLWLEEQEALYAYYGLEYTGASLADRDEDDEDDDEEPLEEDAAVARGGLWPHRS
jgi:hypothetical protein